MLSAEDEIVVEIGEKEEITGQRLQQFRLMENRQLKPYTGG